MITPEKLTVASSVSGQISACLIEVVEVYTLSRSLSLICGGTIHQCSGSVTLLGAAKQ